VNGDEATPFATPWVVSLGGCGGTLISATEVVTAAHCVDMGWTQGWSVTVNAHDISANEDEAETLLVNKVYIHNNYDSSTLDNDIAMLVLAEPVTKTDKYALWHGGPDADSYPDLASSNKVLTVFGWGATSSGGPSSNVLLQVDVTAWTNENCATKYGTDSITDSMLCAGDAYPGCNPNVGTCVDSCQGDSGGPLVTTVDDKTILVGVVSWGIGCASGWPGVYARVLKLADFVANYQVYGEEVEGSGGCTNTNNCGGSSYILAQDSYGDGWNGATVTVKTCDGTPLLNEATFGDGLCQSSKVFCFDNPAAAPLVVETTEGDYPSEVSWSLYNENGGTLSGGAGEVISECTTTSTTTPGFGFFLQNEGFCAYEISSPFWCEAAAGSLGFNWKKSVNKNWPTGCSVRGGKAWFNTREGKACRAARECICMTTPPPFSVLTSGKCNNAITDAATCEAVADALGLKWTKAKANSKWPTGCVALSRNDKVFLNTKSTSKKCNGGKKCLCLGS